MNQRERCYYPNALDNEKIDFKLRNIAQKNQQKGLTIIFYIIITAMLA